MNMHAVRMLTSSTAKSMTSNFPVLRSSAYTSWSMVTFPIGLAYDDALDSWQRLV